MRKSKPNENPNVIYRNNGDPGISATNVSGQIRYHAYISSLIGDKKNIVYIDTAHQNQIIFQLFFLPFNVLPIAHTNTGTSITVAPLMRIDRPRTIRDNTSFFF